MALSRRNNSTVGSSVDWFYGFIAQVKGIDEYSSRPAGRGEAAGTELAKL